MSEVLRMPAASLALRDAFLGWQCRVRQIVMREGMGRPGPGIMPDVTLPGEAEPLGAIITVLCKSPQYSLTPELRHMAARTNDPAQRREAALRYFSETYYQKSHEFSDILTATFPPGSPGAARLHGARRATLTFAAYAQRWDLDCRVWLLGENNPLWQATFAHNRLFNPDLPGDTVILGFEPDWSRAIADPQP